MDTITNRMSTDISDENTSPSNLSDIQRFFVNSSMAIGSLYDARDESIVGRLDGDIQSNKEKVDEKTSSRMYKEENLQAEKLFEILRIDDETRLATILKLIEPNGILSVLNYSSLIDNFTRLIYYFEPIKEESLIYDSGKHNHLSTSSTHVITKVKLGISFVIILQLAPKNASSIETIDRSLEDLCSILNSDIDIKQIIPNEEQLSKNIRKTKIYSNKEDLCRLNNVFEVYQKVQSMRQDPHQYCPLSFTLTPINRYFPHSDFTKDVCILIDKPHTILVESVMLPMSLNVKMLEKDLQKLKSSLLKDYLQSELDYADQLFNEFEKSYFSQLEKFKTSLIQIRSGRMPQGTLAQLLDTEEQKLLLKERDNVTNYFNDLKSKKLLIFDLQKDKIDYLNVFKTNVNQDDDQLTLEDKLTKNDRNIRIFCSNNHLRSTDHHHWDELLAKLIGYRANKPELRLVYADFTYSSYKLERSEIVYSKKGQKKKKVIGATKEDSKKTPCKTNSTINIVLFGESGVGKSTFLNALANYLLYENIDQARSDEPIVIIPVEFLMTINDQFDERLIEFGRSHSNENHNNLGQSVTQQCKSYQFSTRDGKTLKIIDTPGFGDTRGQDQDEKNLNEIFSYLQNLTHLNALCILLKPNVKELNPSFKSSFRQMLHFFGDQFDKNIFFCFTNSQSTFFTIGDTGPELSRFIRKCQRKQMYLKKENTFCFDSESFRYLVASQYSIKFDQQFIDQFEKSWFKSVKESNRLVDQICLLEKQNYINHTWITNEQIKREINHLIRPILEGIRNICRNIILSDNESFKKSIQLISTPLGSFELICYKSDRHHKTFGEFHIMSDDFHRSSDPCESEHLTTNYRLDYQFVEKKTDYSSEDANFYLYGLVKASAHFDYFLNNDSQENKDGPFLSGINRMVREEKSICEREEQHRLNKKLSSRLNKLKERYDKDFEEINSIDEHSYLKSIYSRIEGIRQMPMLYEQLIPDHRQVNQETED